MKKGLGLVAAIAACLISAFGFSRAAGGKTPETIARELLTVSRLNTIGEQVLDQLIQGQKKRMPNIPEQFWIDFRKGVGTQELNEKIIQIYTQHFSPQEMEEIIAFYKTDTGQKFLDKLPEVTQESMAAGREWDMEIRGRMRQNLQAADFGKTDAAEDAAQEEKLP